MRNGVPGAAGVHTLTPSGAGWELFRDQPLREIIRERIDQSLTDMTLPIKPVDVGRFDIILDASGTARLLSQTIGAATELDRVLGYEANAGGTSYINAPLEMLGTLKVASPIFSVTANRSERGSVATVGWDDEGVVPQPFQLVQNGVLTDFQTTREGGGWLQDWYGKQNIAPRSHGCAYAPSAVEPQMPHTANLVMAPGKEAIGFDELISSTERGLALRGTGFGTDFQKLNGLGSGGQVFEIKNGRRVAQYAGAAVLFRTPELLKSIIRIGGPQSAFRIGLDATKGEPPQKSYHSVTAVPVAIKDVTIIDLLRKA